MVKHKRLPPLDLNQRYSIPEALDYLRISRGLLYKKVRDGKLELIRECGRSFVAGQTIAELSRPPSA
jgi:hypothetical protein